jgi:hypothetical protein
VRRPDGEEKTDEVAEVDALVLLTETYDLVVVNAEKAAKLAACHCLLESNFSFEAIYDGLPIFLIERAKMNCDCEPHHRRDHIDEPVQTLALARCLFCVEDITILKFDNVAMLTTRPPFEYHEIRFCGHGIDCLGFFYPGLCHDENALWIYILFEKAVDVLNNGRTLNDELFEFVTR